MKSLITYQNKKVKRHNRRHVVVVVVGTIEGKYERRIVKDLSDAKRQQDKSEYEAK